jgi:hypothetical protein
MKSNLTAFRFRRGRQRIHELFDFVKDVDDGLLVNVQPSRQSPLQFRKFFRQMPVLRQRLAHLHERPHYKDAHLHSARTVQDIRRHDRAVFGKGVWQRSAATPAFL